MAGLRDIWGQPAALGALRHALTDDQLPGAYLFVGGAGVGKAGLARAFAQAAACVTPDRHPFDACQTCESCRRMQAGTQPEVVTITPAGEQMQIWQFWERDNKPDGGILSRTLNYAPAIGKRRVYILENADALNESAANSLLKVLEEPPPYALFVLLASHPSRALPTIVSRSQVIRVQAAPVPELAAYLEGALAVAPDRAAMLAAYAEGRIGQAVRLAQNPTVRDEIERVMDFAVSLPDAPRVRALKVAEQMRKLATQIKALLGDDSAPSAASGEEGEVTGKERVGRRQLAAIFDLLTAFYRDLLTLRVGGGAERVVNRDRLARLERLAQSCSPERLTRCLDALQLARRRLDANANITLLTESLAMALLA